jgi:hypothetical protein
MVCSAVDGLDTARLMFPRYVLVVVVLDQFLSFLRQCAAVLYSFVYRHVIIIADRQEPCVDVVYVPASIHIRIIIA